MECLEVRRNTYSNTMQLDELNMRDEENTATKSTSPLTLHSTT